MLALSSSGEKFENYLDLLGQFGFLVGENGIWASVGLPSQDFGWKLHLSSVQSQAMALLSRVLPVLHEEGVPFKIAKDSVILGELNEGTFGATQVGKFATIYPHQPSDSRRLALHFATLTEEFEGPYIVTDLHIGGVVYTRYGSFNPQMQRDRLGNIAIVEGQDAGYKVPFAPPLDRPNPFADYTSAAPPSENRSHLIGPGYLPTLPLSIHAKGSVMLGLDMRSQDGMGMVVLKEGRQWCMSDCHGRHIWNRLHHQYELGIALGDAVPIAKPRDIFQYGKSLFLVLDLVQGRDFSERSAVPFGMSSPIEKMRLLTDFAGLVASLRALHDRGVVHRDLSPRNIRVAPDGRVHLLDLEMAHRIDDDSPPFMQGTRGFISPQQLKGAHPRYEDDIYSLGCLLVNALSGFDPRRISLVDDESLGERLEGLTQASRALISLCISCLSTDPRDRPKLDEIACQLSRANDVSDGQPKCILAAPALATKDIISRSLLSLVNAPMRDRWTGLPLSPEIESTGHMTSLSVPQAYKLYRSTSRGVAGVLYSIARIRQAGVDMPGTEAFAGRAIDWLLAHEKTPDDQMQGLHFGEAGVALAIAETLRAGLISHGAWVAPYMKEALSAEPDWPDLTHGAAGQGIAALSSAAILGMPDLSIYAGRYANYLVDTQNESGSWAWPEGVAGMEGTTYTGLAHGVAGIVWFLAGLCRHLVVPAIFKAAERGADWLLTQARRDEGRQHLWWPMIIGEEQAWHWWCHGGPGIALALLAVYEITGREECAEAARAALTVHGAAVRHPNLSQCHGLAGLGEIYLEAFRILGDEAWFERADSIAETLIAMRQENDGHIGWMVENPYHSTADLMIGNAGVIHFIARCRLEHGARLGMPLGFQADVPHVATLAEAMRADLAG